MDELETCVEIERPAVDSRHHHRRQAGRRDILAMKISAVSLLVLLLLPCHLFSTFMFMLSCASAVHSQYAFDTLCSLIRCVYFFPLFFLISGI